MSELTDKLWPAFRAEVGEQVEALELALVGRPADVQVNEVFRYMHTIKGGCAMMGFVAMEALAHAAEDFLDRVRRGESALDDDRIDVLLAAVDALKQQLQEAEQTRRDPAPQEALVARLRSLATATPARRKKGSAAAKPAAATPEGVAAEARRLLPGLAAACADPALPALPDCATWRAAAMAQQCPALAQRLQALQQAPSRPQRLGLLADLIDRLRHLESERGEDCGTTAAARALQPLLAAELAGSAAALFDALPLLTAARSATSRAERAVALQSFLVPVRQALVLASLLGLAQTFRLLRVMAQLLRDVQRDLLVLEAELVEVLSVVASLPLELQDGVGEDGTYVAMAGQMLVRLQCLARAGWPESARRRALQERLALDPAVLEALTAQSLLMLESAVSAGDSVMELEADLEMTPDRGEAFVAWVSATGQLIHSFTRLTGGEEVEAGRLRFLVAFPMAEDEVRQQLGVLDPGRQWYRLLKDDVAVPAADRLITPLQADSAAAPATPAAATLRIDSGVLDQFVSRVGEMVTLRNMLAHTLHDEALLLRLRRLRRQTAERGARLTAEDASALHALLGDMEARFEALDQADVRIQSALGRLQEDVLGLRVVPIGVVFNRLPRVIRDLAHAQQKFVDVGMQGEDVRIDKGMVDILIEPLMHMVRNSVDHGIEAPAERERAGKPARARLLLRARQQGNSLIIEIQDDGRGLQRERIRQKAFAAGLIADAEASGLSDRELCNLIFLPGFSTAEQVSEVSGRGVGMDIVRTRVAQVGGQIEVASEPGAGTCFTLRLPLTAAIQSVVMVAAGASQYGLPERNVLEVINVSPAAIQRLQGQTVCLLRGVTLPLYHLGVLLGGPEPGPLRTGVPLEVVVLSDGLHRIGVLVDSVLGRPEVFLRDMHPDIARLPGIGGVSILGNGGVLIILDCERLFELAVRNAQSLRSLLCTS